jgi:hypothetical protein
MFAAWDVKPTKADNQISRNFSHPRPGNFCVIVLTFRSHDLEFQFELLNLGNNQVEIQGHTDRSINKHCQINVGPLEAGNYRLTLTNISNVFSSVQPCLEGANKIVVFF